jgi:hypothetical protein
MKSIAKIEAQIAETERLIKGKQRLRSIAQFPGAGVLAELFEDTKDFYEQSIRMLDENSPVLSKEYAKHKACLALVNSFIAGLESSEDALNDLKAVMLALNEELQNAQDQKKRRDKEAF